MEEYQVDYKKINKKFDELIQNTNGKGEENINDILDKLNYDVMSAIECKFDGDANFSMNINFYVRGDNIKFSIDDGDEVLICECRDLTLFDIRESIVNSIDRINSLVCNCTASYETMNIHIKTYRTHFSELL